MITTGNLKFDDTFVHLQVLDNNLLALANRGNNFHLINMDTM